MRPGIDDINNSDESTFVEMLGGIFEHSPWVASAVVDSRPFASREALHTAMVAAMRAAPEARRMDLLCQHPELAGKEAEAGTLTDASRREQAGAGLNACTADELTRIATNNRNYSDKFGFPFIIAVTGLDKQQIIAAMEERLAHDFEQEFATALIEVEKIARIRIDKLFDE